jgi:hypothetical protein
MSSLDSWAPPGLPAPTGTARRSRTFALQAAVGVVVLGGAFSYLRGVRDDLSLVLAVGALIGALAVVLGVQTARTEVSAGPGWLAVRGVVRRSWVRTDQLAEVTVSRSRTERVLTLRDADRRKVAVLLSDLRLDPAVSRQVARDVRTAVAAGARLGGDAKALLLG